MGKSIPLDTLIHQYPNELLGRHIAQKFSNTLPYLFKVLAAAQSLSIQAHPGKQDAEEGFDRENRLNIPMDSPIRNYRDNRHKPECICAITPFKILKGFRVPETIALMMETLCPAGLSDDINILKTNRQNGLKAFFKRLLTLTEDRKKELIDEAIKNADKYHDENEAFAWIVKLRHAYPSDIGILSPAILNLITLVPGQALFLPSGEMHSYLDGVGIELMANSDNVIRGGLTPKHVDVNELLRILRFTGSEARILLPETAVPGEAFYPLDVDEFSLSVITIAPGLTYTSPVDRSVEILLCMRGSANVMFSQGEEKIGFQRGDSILIPAAMNPYQISGNATIYKAGVPL
jgi:mannose-6-phosphate isomerase